MELVDESSADAAMYLSNLGSVALMQGDAGLARSRFEQSLALRRALGDDGGIARAVQARAGPLRARGARGRAQLFSSASTSSSVSATRSGSAELADAFALLAAAGGDARRAARLVGWANELREELGRPRCRRR